MSPPGVLSGRRVRYDTVLRPRQSGSVLSTVDLHLPTRRVRRGLGGTAVGDRGDVTHLPSRLPARDSNVLHNNYRFAYTE